MYRLFAAAVAMLAVGSACAQPAPTVSMEDVFAGRVCPLSYQLKSLDATWRRVTVAQEAEGGYLDAMMASMYGSQGPEMYYTKGDTLQIVGETYAIAYKAPSKPMDMSAMSSMSRMSSSSRRVALKPDNTLCLCLLNLRTLGSMTDIRAFDLALETAPPPEGEEEPAEPETMASSPARSEKVTAESQSLSNLRQLALSLQMYSADYDGVLPKMGDLSAAKKALLPYAKNEGLFTSPVTKTAYAVNPAVSGKKVKSLGKPGTIVVFYETKPGKDGTRGVAFADGQGKRIPEKQWPALKQASKIP